MKKLICILLCAFVVETVGVSAYAEDPEVEVILDVGKLTGHTTYQVGGTVHTPSGTEEVHFPISELKFPLDVYMVSAEGSIEFEEKWRVRVGVKKNITSDAGKMEDSDWGVPFEDPPDSDEWWWHGPDSLDVYSESDADLDALILDMNLRYKFHEKTSWSFIGGIGYIRQNFDYECSLIRQWSPSGLSGWDSTGTGDVGLTYEVTYSVPFIELATKFNIDKFSVEARLGYSPIVKVEDEDHHLSRPTPMVSKGDCDGDAILFSLEGRYDLPENWFLTLGFDYTKISADGTSRTYIDGRYDHTIDLEIESKQILAAFGVGYAF